MVGRLIPKHNWAMGKLSTGGCGYGGANAELVWVSTIEQCEVVADVVLGDKSQELWGLDSARKDYVTSAGLVGVTERVFCDHGEVCSEGDVQYATTGARSGEGLDVELVPESAVGRDSPVSLTLGYNLVFVEKRGSTIGENGGDSPAGAILGSVGAFVASVIRFVEGSARKVKLVNSLVEALGSSAQQRVIATARSRRGRSRPAKGNYPVEACGEVECGIISVYAPLLLLDDDRDWDPRPFRFLNCLLDCKDIVRRFGVEWLRLAELGVGMELWLGYGG
ncbi:hypothetical protein V6N11_076751 [Hibiscus sabdariffa]|uniref:Uncharacterized protein n=2 Tax=Hibiscus sabdariffa TaxID=183260 RepID=A0ABR2P9C4_9ROSI